MPSESTCPACRPWSACPCCSANATAPPALNTAGFISGYRGSPLGMYDHALWRAKSLPAIARHRLRPRPQRGPRRDGGVGQPAGRAVPGRQGRWRVRHLVRQGPGRRPLGRCAEARQFGRHLAPRRRAGARRRRSWLPVLDPGASERAGVCRGADADHQSRRPCRNISISASMALRCRAIPAAGSASRRSARRSRARPRSTAIRRGCRSSFPMISRCRRAVSTSAGPIRRWKRRSGCSARRWRQ